MTKINDSMFEAVRLLLPLGDVCKVIGLSREKTSVSPRLETFRFQTIVGDKEAIEHAISVWSGVRARNRPPLELFTEDEPGFGLPDWTSWKGFSPLLLQLGPGEELGGEYWLHNVAVQVHGVKASTNIMCCSDGAY